MVNLNINTRLGVTPSMNYPCPTFTTIKRGATAEIEINFNNYPYIDLYAKEEEGVMVPYSNFNQITFIFKHPDGTYKEYKLYETVNGMPSYSRWFRIDFETNSLSFLLTSKETSELPLATLDDPILFEIVFDMDTDKLILQEVDSIIIEPQPPVVVIDSLYNKGGFVTKGGATE